MNKSDAERGIRHLCREWAKLRGVDPDTADAPSFPDFLSWVRENHSLYLKFRTTTSVRNDVELWFDQEFRQSWRR
jgi:hypothetical protein